MPENSTQRFARWKEKLELVYGKEAVASKAWLRASFGAGKPARRDAGAGADLLGSVRADLGECSRCKLCSTRKTIVFGEGSPTARLMFIGEGPGEQEDIQGRPFVGAAGQLLDKIIDAMGMRREDVYIANVVKCRPPKNRLPEPDEVAACEPFLFRQIDVIRPAVMVALGGTALKCLFHEDVKISQLRGKFVAFRGAKLMPTFHPAFLLRNPSAKKDVWDDMKKVKKELGLP